MGMAAHCDACAGCGCDAVCGPGWHNAHYPHTNGGFVWGSGHDGCAPDAARQAQAAACQALVAAGSDWGSNGTNASSPGAKQTVACPAGGVMSSRFSLVVPANWPSGDYGLLRDAVHG